MSIASILSAVTGARCLSFVREALCFGSELWSCNVLSFVPFVFRHSHTRKQCFSRANHTAIVKSFDPSRVQPQVNAILIKCTRTGCMSLR